MNVLVDCGGPDTEGRHWWNYCIHDMGAGERPDDLLSPLFYRSKLLSKGWGLCHTAMKDNRLYSDRNAAPAVYDMNYTLKRHMMYFFADINLKTLDLVS